MTFDNFNPFTLLEHRETVASDRTEMNKTMKLRPILYSQPMVKAKLAGLKDMTRRPVKGYALDWLNQGFTPEFVASPDNDLCPYGKVGDVLWGRETFVKMSWGYEYRADSKEYPEHIKWKPSIFMPFEAARIFDEIVSIRIERLGDITEEDAKREGVDMCKLHGWQMKKTYLGGFVKIWTSIHGSWTPEQWVWVITTKRIEKPNCQT